MVKLLEFKLEKKNNIKEKIIFTMLNKKISIAQSHRKGDLQSLLEDSHTWLVS